MALNINIENKKQIAIISLAVGLGLVAAILVGSHIQSSIQKETAALAREYEEKKIQPLVQQVEMLSGEIKNLAARQIAMQEQQQLIVAGQGPTSPTQAPTASLAIKTPAGKRALTVLVDSLSAVGGLINPGDYVDIMGHISIPPPPNTSLQPEKVTAILFQNMQILAVGTQLQPTGSYEGQQGSLNITLAVNPEEAGLLTFAQQQGRLQLVLRSPSETETQILQPASWDALAEYALDKNGMELLVPRARAVIQPVGPGGVVPAPAEEVKPYIQIFRGGREL